MSNRDEKNKEIRYDKTICDLLLTSRDKRALRQDHLIFGRKLEKNDSGRKRNINSLVQNSRELVTTKIIHEIKNERYNRDHTKNECDLFQYGSCIDVRI